MTSDVAAFDPDPHLELRDSNDRHRPPLPLPSPPDLPLISGRDSYRGSLHPILPCLADRSPRSEDGHLDADRLRRGLASVINQAFAAPKPVCSAVFDFSDLHFMLSRSLLNNRPFTLEYQQRRRSDSSGKLGRHGQDVQSVTDSPMLETTSSFGSTSSALSLSNLPPIRVRPDDRSPDPWNLSPSTSRPPEPPFWLTSSLNQSWPSSPIEGEKSIIDARQVFDEIPQRDLYAAGIPTSSLAMDVALLQYHLMPSYFPKASLKSVDNLFGETPYKDWYDAWTFYEHYS